MVLLEVRKVEVSELGMWAGLEEPGLPARK